MNMQDILKWTDIEEKLSKSDYKKFQQWMIGQTCPIDGVWVWDFQRWLKEGKKTDQNAETWD